jgi:hypothetical protein
MSTCRRLAAIDVAAILLLGTLWVAAEALGVPKRWTFACVGVALVVYAVALARRGDDRWRDLGLRTDNLRPALAAVGSFTLIAALGIVIFARLRGQSLWRADMAILLPLYPCWGVAQQVIFQGILHRRLMTLVPGAPLQILLTAAAFAAVHAGNAMLVLLTFAAGLAWSLLFRRWPNTWALGLSHGVLAALAYPLVLGDAPLARV